MFASDRDAARGMYDLFTMKVDGTSQVNITNTPDIVEDYPNWSPDGSKIVFSRDGNLYTVTPAGGSLTQLTNTPAVFEFEPDWSPTATQIVYRTGIIGNDEIWKMNANGTGQTNLTNNGSLVDEHPVWSPAGDKIAFTRDAFKNAEVYTMNADGSSANADHQQHGDRFASVMAADPGSIPGEVRAPAGSRPAGGLAGPRLPPVQVPEQAARASLCPGLVHPAEDVLAQPDDRHPGRERADERVPGLSQGHSDRRERGHARRRSGHPRATSR